MKRSPLSDLTMTPETYVVGSIILSMIVVAFPYFLPTSTGEFLKCPRCGAEMQFVRDALEGVVIYVVAPAVRKVQLQCPRCGYSPPREHLEHRL